MVFNDYYLRIVEENRPYPDCECKITAKLRLSTSDLNPRRRFFNCSRSLVSPDACKWFRWVDDELSRHYKSEVLSLIGLVRTQTEDLQEIPRLKRKMAEVKEEGEAKLEVAVLRIIELEDEMLQLKKKDARKLKWKWMMFVVLVVLAVGLFIKM